MTTAAPAWPDFDETEPFHRWLVRTCRVCGQFWDGVDGRTFLREWRAHCAEHREGTIG